MDTEEVARTVLIVVVSIFAVIGLIAVALVAFVAVRFRHALPGAVAVAGALLYGASPIDLLPEWILGPVGLIDDVGILGAAVAFFVYQLRRRRERENGNDGDEIVVKRLD